MSSWAGKKRKTTTVSTRKTTSGGNGREAGVDDSSSSDGDGGDVRVAPPVNTVNFVVVVKYVRREIRTLTDRDRETFFNAVSLMQRVPSAVGQQIYGRKYYSKDFFNRLHLYYGTYIRRLS